eukprot:scpid24935/ scgid27816/ Myosin-IIIa
MPRQSSASALGGSVVDGEVNDLATLTHLDEAVMLRQMKTRYQRDVIYTYVGDILVAINPFKQLKIYDRESVTKYKRTKKALLPPHIYAIADAAYSTMVDSGKNQCCVISGESGAGKTESTKLLINQVIELCPTKTTMGLEQKIIQVNPLLEAFGNAQTVMNDNSSRFGKYIQLKFKGGQVLGAKINEYLLEKSRVVSQSVGEENFHIFYYMFAGLSKEEMQQYRLTNADSYRYLSQGESCLRKRRKECQDAFNDLVNAMDLVGFTEENQNNMFQVMSIVLNMGNIEFNEGANDSSSVKTFDSLKTTAELVGIEPKVLESFLTTHETMTAGEVITINLTKQKAEDARDAMAKALYGRVFSWIINRVNSLLAPQDDNQRGDSTQIGILDIFGFEHFEKNSFEQCCINVANEQLQFFFNEHIFKWEQEEYRKEGIDFKEIVYLDNKPLLSLFLEKPIGLFSLLDEESRFPKATDLSFVGKLNQHFGKLEHYVASKDSRTPHFVVKHYAGEVKYDGDGFLEKNRDSLPSGAVELLQISKNDLIHDIFMATLTRTGTMALKSRRGRSRKTRNRLQAAGRVSRTAGKGTSLKGVTVSAQFKNSLTVLMEKMNQCNPHFIRCIKPNMGKRPNDFQDDFVIAQLRYTGMLETTRIRREGFAIRPDFNEFVNRFKHLAPLKIGQDANGARKILQAADIKGYHIGKTKVFLKYFHIDQLTDKLERIHKAATMWQKVLRGHVDRRRVKKLREKAKQEKQQVADFLVQLPSNLVNTSKRMQAIMAADFKRPHDYFKAKAKAKEPAKPLIALNDMPPPLPPLADEKFPRDDDEDDDDDEDEFDENDEVKPMPISKKHGAKFGREGTKAASVRWFKETQAKSGAKNEEGNFQDWFHGIITRRRAEQLLTNKDIGAFLVRVSESRFGYSLSFRVATRVKHFMIDQTMSGKYIVVGEPKVHKSLHDLVVYHQRCGIGDEHELLSVPCGQDSGDDEDEFDYADLMDHGGEQALMFRSPSSTSSIGQSPNMRRRVHSGHHRPVSTHSAQHQQFPSGTQSRGGTGSRGYAAGPPDPGYRQQHMMYPDEDPRNRRHATNPPPMFSAPKLPGQRLGPGGGSPHMPQRMHSNSSVGQGQMRSARSPRSTARNEAPPPLPPR